MLHRIAAVIFLVSTALLSLSAGRQGICAESSREPNIVLILADDLGYSDLCCYGGEIKTPNIDALAHGGVRFTQLYNSARCCPSRASLMTGLYPSQAGIGDFTTARPSRTRGPGYLGRLRDDCVTLAEVLKPAGYACYYVGKWHMHPETGPIRRGFDEFYGFTNDHSHDQYDADYYIRLPEERKKEIDPPQGEFYATDVFNQYALEFLRQGRQTGKPWFLFLAHSSPHFPIQAPAERADKYEATYLRGWDVLREERFARQQQIGLVDGPRWTLTPRSLVPVDRDDIANGYSGQPNPTWDSLDEDRQHDLARRMAVFAAMAENVDRGVGQIVDYLKTTGQLDNTLILFLSDNGACYEWGPFGFDGVSRAGTTILHTGDDLRKIGGPGTHHSYGSAWANLGNTPFRLYKHFTHEGGISTPFIAHWPAGIGSPDRWIREPAHVMDILPTLLEATGATYPAEHDGHAVTPVEGKSLLPVMRGGHLPERSIGFDHQQAHALRKGDWKIVWSKRMPHDIRWELYNLAEDRCETRDLAAVYPERVAAMAAEWEQWARRVGVVYEGPPDAHAGTGESDTSSPQIANRPLTITGRVERDGANGVVVSPSGSSEPARSPVPRDFSGWRGGIGIAFGTPSRDIADVTEMGYDIVWGSDDPRAIRALGLSVFRYWNSIVETSLKGPGYDFSQMPDKDEAAKVKSMLVRIAESLRLQLAQRALDRELGNRFPHKAWSRFCQGGKWDAAVARTGKGSLAVVGGTYAAPMPQWKYFNRQGAAQFVSLNQTVPEPIVVRGFSKAQEVAASEEVVLDTPAARRRHFDAREGHAYGMHLYLDYQDGQWPEVYTARFSLGTHDWEEKSIRVEPTRPVKTAMVLLEFHQPQGAAWFDDLRLSSGKGADRNLLAAPGFEEKDEAAVQSQAISPGYEEQARALLTSVEAAASSADLAKTLPVLAKQVDDLAASVTDKGLAPYFPCELRDLDDAREKLCLCRSITQ